MILHPAAPGGQIANPWQRKSAPATQYTVKRVSSDARRVLLEPDNGAIPVWFDIAAVLVACYIGQTLEVSEVSA